MTTTKHTAAPATIGLIGGIAASLAGNLQAINLGDTSPGIGAYVSALFWPLALFVAIEIMLRTPWVPSARDSMTKWVGLLGVSFLALYISYGHLSHVLAAYGYDTVASHVGPLAIDGLMAMATLSMNRVGQGRRMADIPAAVPATTPAVVQDDLEAAWSLAAFLPQPTEAPALAAVPAAEELAAAPAPRRMSGKLDEVEAKELIVTGLENGIPVGTIDSILAGWYGVNPRTVRRLRDRLGLVSVSAVPAQA